MSLQLPLEPEPLRNLMINYIPSNIDEMQLRQLFEMYGPIESLKVVVDRDTRQSRGYGFVKYRFGASAMHAIKYLNGYPILNKRLKVSYGNAYDAQRALSDPTNPFSGGVEDQVAYYRQQMAMLQYYQAQMSAMAADVRRHYTGQCNAS
jgi:RNA recognition motif-containing protein